LNQFEKIQGKELSFNNILDFSMVYEVLNWFPADSHPGFSIIVKHQNPCGAALGNSQTEAFKKKKKLRIIKIPLGYREKSDIKTVPGGFVFQDRDHRLKAYEDFELKTSRPLTENEITDVRLGWKLIKFVKSNAIIIVKDGMLLGVGAGQMSRVDSVDIAIGKSQFPVEGSVLISDAFFPFADSVEIAAKHNITVMVEPGGSVRDNEVIEKAEECNISLLFTAMRHFRH
jgi:phosphoribosylaminoimidazolecarboxamide formyltransferase/IMP cyclohydrolase